MIPTEQKKNNEKSTKKTHKNSIPTVHYDEKTPSLRQPVTASRQKVIELLPAEINNIRRVVSMNKKKKTRESWCS